MLVNCRRRIGILITAANATDRCEVVRSTMLHGRARRSSHTAMKVESLDGPGQVRCDASETSSAGDVRIKRRP